MTRLESLEQTLAVITRVLRDIAGGAVCRSCQGTVLTREAAAAMLAQRPEPPPVIPATPDGRLDLRGCIPCKSALLDAMKPAQ